MPKHISTTVLSKKVGLTSRDLFAEFEILGWITSERNLTVEGFSVGGIYKEITKKGETIKYIAWPEDIELGITPQETNLLTATQLGTLFELSALKINYLLAEIGWAKKGELNKGWLATEHGLGIGAVQTEDIKTGVPYIRWPETVKNNSTLHSTVADFNGEAKTNLSNSEVQAFRERFSTKYRSTDGHMTRSKAEALIDNWLYMFEIAHAYERKLPIEDEVYSSFYIPHGKVYIEYFGCENDESYGYDKNCERRKKEKLEVYQKYNFNLIVIEEKDIENLDDVLPKMLLKYGVQTY
jgi:hypothetical protein